MTVILAILTLVVEVIIVRTASSYEPQINIVYARTKIPAKTRITEDMLTIKKVNISYAHKLSVKEMGKITGRIAKIDIEENEMMLESRIDADSMQNSIKVSDPGNRLFTLDLKGDQANGWLIKEGQLVDILFIPVEKPGVRGLNNEQNFQFKKIKDAWQLQEGCVLRLKKVRIAAVLDEKGKILERNEKYLIPKYVCLEVNDIQDEFLAYAKGNGRIELSVVPDH